MYETLYKAIALMIIFYVIYHLLKLIRNIIEESRKIDRDKAKQNRPDDAP